MSQCLFLFTLNLLWPENQLWIFFRFFFYLFYVFSTVIHRAFMLSLSQLICFWSFRVMFRGDSHSITSWNYRHILQLRPKFYGRFLFKHKCGIIFSGSFKLMENFAAMAIKTFFVRGRQIRVFFNTMIWMMVFFCLDKNLYIYLFKKIKEIIYWKRIVWPKIDLFTKVREKKTTNLFIENACFLAENRFIE